jgi:cytidine deaminase
MSDASLSKAHKQAVEAMKRAHAPYSHLQVACAVKLRGKEECVVGVNVENASYGGTICAERSALVSMVSQFGRQEIEFVVVISSFQGGPIPPCGICLQVLKEFVSEDCPIHLGDASGVKKTHLFKEFLPLAFSADMLPD